MCGIVGIYNYKSNKKVSTTALESMSEAIAYRGPDGHGYYYDHKLAFGHRRLTIIDTSERANQPMSSADESHIICYNGEVYNYLEIKNQLVKDGVNFKTTSDTEVILELFQKEGVDSLKRLNGMFAFAIWNKQTSQLVLARDRLGIKPLFYALTKNGIVFASEIKSILQLPEIKRDVNLSLIDSYMSLGYCPTEETLFSGIYKLPPGHFLTIENGQVQIKRYWDMHFDKTEDRGEDYYLERTRNLFEESVKLQLRSDVPLGVFLSGGIDSSAVVAMMRKLGVNDIKTFSIAWDYGKNFDETQYSRSVASLFNTDHHEYYMRPHDFKSLLPDYIRHMDEPVTEAAAISLFYLAKKTKPQVTVVLSGEGADEVFGGYPIYKYLQLVDRYKKTPAPVRQYLLNPLLKKLGGKWKKYVDLSEKAIEKSYAGVSFYDEQQKNKLYTETFARQASQSNSWQKIAQYYQPTKGHDLQTKMQYLDINTWLVDDLLIKADRMSMAASLELRVPFLDHRFLEFAASMPSKYRLKHNQNKYILKKAMQSFLPKKILYRKKQGFPTPLAVMFQGELFDYVKSTLDSEQAHQRNYFKPDVVRRLLSEHKNTKRDHHRVLWQLLVLELWHREYIDQPV